MMAVIFDSGMAGIAAYDSDYVPPTIEELVEQGRRGSGTSPTHIAFRGAPSPGSIRCEWHGIARTLEQREDMLRFMMGLREPALIPPVPEIKGYFSRTIDKLTPKRREGWRAFAKVLIEGGMTTEYLFLSCFVDYVVSEYLLGSGPSTVTVAYDAALTLPALSYDSYVKAHRDGGYGDEPLLSAAEDT